MGTDVAGTGWGWEQITVPVQLTEVSKLETLNHGRHINTF